MCVLVGLARKSSYQVGCRIPFGIRDTIVLKKMVGKQRNLQSVTLYLVNDPTHHKQVISPVISMGFLQDSSTSSSGLGIISQHYPIIMPIKPCKTLSNHVL